MRKNDPVTIGGELLGGGHAIDGAQNDIKVNDGWDY